MKIEIAGLAISAVACLLSILAMSRTRKINSAMLKLEKKHAELSQLQIELIEEEKRKKGSGDLIAEFVKDEENKRRLKITNTGGSPVSDIYIKVSESCSYVPLLKGELQSKLPYPLLNPEESFSILARVTLKYTDQIFPMRLSWTNKDGESESKDCAPSL